MSALKLYKSNLSLSAAFLDTIKLIDKWNFEASMRKALIDELAKASKHIEGFSNEMILCDELRHQIADTYAPSNKELADQYLDQKQKEYFLN
jgi:hypothetical protein